MHLPKHRRSITNQSTALALGFFVLMLILPASLVAGQEYEASSFENHSGYQKRFYLAEFDEGGDRLFLSYMDVGPREGRVILLVHGVPTSSWSYRFLIQRLSLSGFRVVAPDNLGFGNSAKPREREFYRLEDQGRRLLSLMEHLGVDKWFQLLHDVGGPITSEMLGMAPDRIESMILLNTFAYQQFSF